MKFRRDGGAIVLRSFINLGLQCSYMVNSSKYSYKLENLLSMEFFGVLNTLKVSLCLLRKCLHIYSL